MQSPNSVSGQTLIIGRGFHLVHIRVHCFYCASLEALEDVIRNASADGPDLFLGPISLHSQYLILVLLEQHIPPSLLDPAPAELDRVEE